MLIEKYMCLKIDKLLTEICFQINRILVVILTQEKVASFLNATDTTINT